MLTPAAPALTAARRGSTIEVGFTVPGANVDGSRPANIVRIDIYAVTGAAGTMTDLEMVKWGTRVASVPVKSPRNPNDTVEPGESTDVLDPLEGKGLDQGAASMVAEQVGASILEPGVAGGQKPRRPVQVERDRPLLGPTDAAAVRTYIGVGINKRGQPGKFSQRLMIPLALAPAPPSQPTIAYDETTITVRWDPPSNVQSADASPELLPSKPFGSSLADIAYHVYDSTSGVRLTPAPVKALQYKDGRIEWGAMRCYVVRAVEIVGKSPLESDGGEPRCETLVDTFPPAAPKGLNAVATDGAINLIWEASTEPDLAGYFVLRSRQPNTGFERITSTPEQDASFRDNVTPGIRFVYVVVAVDKAGNISMHSKEVEETAH